MSHSPRYEELKYIFNEKKISISDSDMKLYASMFDIISIFVHGKLTTWELVESFDFLSDLLMGKKPQYAVSIPKSERIRIQLRMMEELPQTAGKLTEEEKEAYAFCVFHATCIQVYDEQRQITVSGLTEFTSFEHIKKLFEYEKQMRPEFFLVDNRDDTMLDGLYGLEADYPIRLTSIPMSYAYLNCLYYGDSKISYSRVGSATNKYGELIDLYDVSVEEKKLFRKTTKTWTLYINAYAVKPIIKAPKGFTLQMKKQS